MIIKSEDLLPGMKVCVLKIEDYPEHVRPPPYPFDRPAIEEYIKIIDRGDDYIYYKYPASYAGSDRIFEKNQQFINHLYFLVL